MVIQCLFQWNYRQQLLVFLRNKVAFAQNLMTVPRIRLPPWMNAIYNDWIAKNIASIWDDKTVAPRLDYIIARRPDESSFPLMSGLVTHYARSRTHREKIIIKLIRWTPKFIWIWPRWIIWSYTRIETFHYVLCGPRKHANYRKTGGRQSVNLRLINSAKIYKLRPLNVLGDPINSMISQNDLNNPIHPHHDQVIPFTKSLQRSMYNCAINLQIKLQNYLQDKVLNPPTNIRRFCSFSDGGKLLRSWSLIYSFTNSLSTSSWSRTRPPIRTSLNY